jgi:hypothetical protein
MEFIAATANTRLRILRCGIDIPHLGGESSNLHQLSGQQLMPPIKRKPCA